uniref:Uncharacterized protein MANES_01G221900 n=1 Tax=Rhizophora mucronata TaxID=61149 RepID=A0A2P2ILK1_RHIMU
MFGHTWRTMLRMWPVKLQPSCKAYLILL